ncbi:hypothetical protein LSAT2_023992 [Lamellibrachia satsuma]|nr:hypothetical protein LSAT2_023992 [Lamellibrachia satsuma]
MLMIYTFQYTGKKPSIHAGDNINRVDTQAGLVGKLWCLSVGEPMPHIKWYHFGQLLENNQTYKIQETERCSRQQSDNGDCEMGRYSELQVTVPKVDEGWIYGDYTCRATNMMGSYDWRVHLGKESK